MANVRSSVGTLMACLAWAAVAAMGGCVGVSSGLTAVSGASGQVVPPEFQTSELWGEEGEKWDPAGRLPDFSYAGYRAGSEIPSVPATANIKDFGAAGDGTTDDTDAFERAISEVENGAVLIPAGRYRITSDLRIERGNLVLRGAGPGESVLYFENSLIDLRGQPDTSSRSYWSANGGLLTISGQIPDGDDQLLARVTEASRRGDRTIRVNTTRGISAGDWVRVILREPARESGRAGSLAEHLVAGLMEPGSLSRTRESPQVLVSFVTPVERVSGNRVTLERALPTDVSPDWFAGVYRFRPTVSDVGIEDLTLEFPDRRYPGHWKEEYNALAIYGAVNSWVRNVEIRNADNGIFVEASVFCTLDRITFSAGPDRGPSRNRWTGHYGIYLGGGAADNLITRFEFPIRFLHELSVTSYAMLNVFSNGRGLDMAFDHHRSLPHSNLFTRIDVGMGRRTFDSGGGDAARYGPHAGAYETFWNIQAEGPVELPAGTFGPRVNLVGVPVPESAQPHPDLEWHLEKIPPGRLWPPNLHDAQRRRFDRSTPGF